MFHLLVIEAVVQDREREVEAEVRRRRLLGTPTAGPAVDLAAATGTMARHEAGRYPLRVVGAGEACSMRSGAAGRMAP